ncbi:ricin-type beta-trefoil lectin domain protein [Micromonospora sp. NPDC049679]|uniref:ricin-type beta-trefoil lectin domain protein n=1 Tax=Micromonospora sp. NPDC049679 TaxID=3155920 RepID=UPI0033CD2E72
MTSSTGDDRREADVPRDDAEPTLRAGLCPRCGRALADDVCLHCVGEDEFRGAALVRNFVNFPDLYSKDSPSGSRPDRRPDDWPARGDGLPDSPPPQSDQSRRAPRAARRGRPGSPSAPPPTGGTRGLLDRAGWGPRGIVAKVVIASGSILLATAIGITGAVVTGPATNSASPSVGTTPPGARSGGPSPRPTGSPTDVSRRPGAGPAASDPAVARPDTAGRSATGALVQRGFCLHDYASLTSNGNPIHMSRCDNSDAQRWTFAIDGTVRVFGRCMRPVGGASAHGTKLELWECDGSPAQQWLRGPDGSLIHPASAACLESPAPDDARPQLAVCDNGPGQRWSLPNMGLAG